jgi:hypothetical protein
VERRRGKKRYVVCRRTGRYTNRYWKQIRKRVKGEFVQGEPRGGRERKKEQKYDSELVNPLAGVERSRRTRTIKVAN